jgi:hypothetical protein
MKFVVIWRQLLLTPAQDRKPKYNTAGDSPAVKQIFVSAVGKEIRQG